MTNEELLQELSFRMQQGYITQHDLHTLISQHGMETSATSVQGVSSAAEVSQSKQSRFTITKLFYLLGAAIACIGIIIFVAQIWEDVSSLMRIIITLGFGLTLAGIGSWLLNERPADQIGSVFHGIAGLLTPLGVAVTLYELDIDGDWAIAIIWMGLTLFYGAMLTIHRRVVLTLFAVGNATTTAYLFLNAAVGDPLEGFFGIKNIYHYMTMLIGIGYLALAHVSTHTYNAPLCRLLLFAGSIGFLGAGFALMFEWFAGELLYIIMLAIGLGVALFLRSQTVLVVTTLFLLAYVTYITSEFFADSLGWPVSLVLLGFVFIGLGYGSVRINKEYIAASQ